jgi:hypothetical protein
MTDYPMYKAPTPGLANTLPYAECSGFPAVSSAPPMHDRATDSNKRSISVAQRVNSCDLGAQTVNERGARAQTARRTRS